MVCQRFILLGIASLLNACGSEPEPSTVPLGSYSYVADVRTRDSEGPTRFTGTLTITKATEDEMRGTWAVEGYESREASGGSIPGADAYVLYSYPAPEDGQIIRHEIGRGETTLPCELLYVFGDIANEGTCTLTKQ